MLLVGVVVTAPDSTEGYIALLIAGSRLPSRLPGVSRTEMLSF